MSVLERKLRRDLRRLAGQVATISIVLACGIMAMLMMRSAYQSLLAARDAYYRDYRLADVFIAVERAPDAVLARLERVPGVAVVATRIVEDVMIPLPDEPDPIRGRIISLPDRGEPPLNAVHLRRGRLPSPGARDEAVVLEQFATAHGLSLGDRVPVVINGRLRHVEVAGIGLSPEYVLAVSGQQMIVDNRLFVVLWMRRAEVAPTFRMDGAFNDVSAQIVRGADVEEVGDRLERELAAYGARPAVTRARQPSNYALTSELGVLQTLAVVIPAMFLGVAAFLVNIVVSRLVVLERVQIAVLKAVGFTDLRLGLHYLALVTLIVAAGSIVGVAAGIWTARWMTALYADFYRFPTKLNVISPALVITCIGIGLTSAVVGATSAIRRIVRLPPAQAMRPPTPLAYRRSLADRLGVTRVVGAPATMAMREITRRPLRFALSVFGIAMSVAIFLLGRFSWDSFDRVMTEVYPREHREDLLVTFARTAPARGVRELAHLPGVEIAEGDRVVPVRIRARNRWRDLALVGRPPSARLRAVISHDAEVPLPPTGILVTDKLAEVLGVGPGDEVEVDVLEGDWRSHVLTIVGVVAEPFGLSAYADRKWLDAMLGDAPSVSTVSLRVDPSALDEVRARLKDTPAVIGVVSPEHVIRAYREQTGQSMVVMTLILTLSAAAIATGVIYNNARIALSMRSRDLATLRILGFSRGEVAGILIGELGVQIVTGVPVGILLGRLLAGRLAASIESEAYRFPAHIAPTTYATAVLIALGSAVASALLVRRKLARLDLVAVLKASSE